MRKPLFTMLLFALPLAGCIKNEEEDVDQPCTVGPLLDADGNAYEVVRIGSQCWMAENLRTTSYCNGEAIPELTDDGAWQATSAGAWVHYENDASNESPYGKLYNHHAAMDDRNICPCGWHVPTRAEMVTLRSELGGTVVAGHKMKTTGIWDDGTGYWYGPGTQTTNSSGFSAQPAGWRVFHGSFSGIFGFTGYWTTTVDTDPAKAVRFVLNSGGGNFGDGTELRGYGFSIRCIKDN
jgi:uncharacterized protein (TIGR02145 family)